MTRTALIFGATGAVGKQVLLDVLKNGTYTRVLSVGRRQIELDDSVPQDKLEQKIVDFDNIEAHRDDFRNVSDVYCCLGTTRADAGSAENFIKIDQTYVLNSAKLVAEVNKPTDADLAPVHFLYCSATNANKNSFFLYPKTKGETECALEEAGFEKVSIFRPAFLETVEPRTRSRAMESIAFTIINPINRLLKAGLVINVATVARAMHKVAEDASIKPTSPERNVKKSVIGSLVSAFSNADIESIGNPK